MKHIGTFFCVCLLLFCIFPHASADNSATKVELYCTVNSEGDCVVSMNVNLHLEASDSSLVFPLPIGARNITMNGSSVSTSSGSSATLVAVGKSISGVVGDFPLRFDYTLPKAVKVNANRQLVLTLPLLCGFDYPVSSLSFIITLPGNIPSQPTFTSIYQQVGFESNLDVVVNSNMITGASRSLLHDHEEVYMNLTVPQSMFPSVSTYQREGNPEIIPMAAFAGLALLYWLLFLRTLPPPHQRASVPPEGISAGELGCRVTMTGGDLSMMVMSWAQMGYLIIQLEGSGRVLLHKRMEMGNERSLFEVRVYQTLFHNRRVVDCSSSGYARLIVRTAGMVPGEKSMCLPQSGSRTIFRALLCIAQVFCGICIAMNLTSVPVLQVLFSVIFGILSAISAWWMHELGYVLFQRYKLKARIALAVGGFWILLGLIAGQPWIPMVSVFVQLLMGFFAAHGGRRTSLNHGESGEILGLRRFLKGIPRPEAARLLKMDSDYFFRMAPYAISLGVGTQFASAFGRRKLDQCPYIVTKVHGKRTAVEWMRLMIQITDSMDDRYRRSLWERWLVVRFR